MTLGEPRRAKLIITTLKDVLGDNTSAADTTIFRLVCIAVVATAALASIFIHTRVSMVEEMDADDARRRRVISA